MQKKYNTPVKNLSTFFLQNSPFQDSSDGLSNFLSIILLCMVADLSNKREKGGKGGRENIS